MQLKFKKYRNMKLLEQVNLGNRVLKNSMVMAPMTRSRAGMDGVVGDSTVQEVVARWKEEGILEHLFLRQTRNGAVLIFREADEEKVKQLMESLPLFKLKKSVEYLNLIKQF